MQAIKPIARRDLIALTLPQTRRTILPHPLSQRIPSPIQPLTQPQTRPSSFLHNDNSSTSGPSRPPQKNVRESWFSRMRRRRERNARPRSKISTLAADHTANPFAFGEDAHRQEGESQEDTNQEGGKTGSEKFLTRRRRKLLIWAAMLSMPVWGRDIVEVVVPGMLGVFLQVAGGLRRGVRWVRARVPGRET